MISFLLRAAGPEPLSVLAIGAHPDDIEIAAGGTLLTLAERHPRMWIRYVVLTGEPQRQAEVRAAARAFTPNADLEVQLHDLPDGRLPAVYRPVKETLEDLAKSFRPDVILAPSPHDAHQDHRIVGELVPTAFRNHAVLNYEIPKWDGDLGRPNVYVPLSDDVARRKVELLDKCFPSQLGRDWWDKETFLGLARLRGIECRVRYAEAFTCTKLVISLSAQPSTRASRRDASRIVARFLLPNPLKASLGGLQGSGVPPGDNVVTGIGEWPFRKHLEVGQQLAQLIEGEFIVREL